MVIEHWSQSGAQVGDGYQESVEITYTACACEANVYSYIVMGMYYLA